MPNGGRLTPNLQGCDIMSLVLGCFSTYPRFRYAFKFLDTPKPAPAVAFRNICPIYLYLLYIIYRGECIYMGEHRSELQPKS